jgi:hypothetical protein
MSAGEKKVAGVCRKSIDCIRVPINGDAEAWRKFIDKGTNGRDITSPEHRAKFERCLSEISILL